MRLFLAVFPPPDVQGAAAAAADRLRAGDGGAVAWVKRENLHFTLRFLGDQDEAAAGRAEAAARAAAAESAPFAGTLAGLGAFPNAQRARTLWVGLTEGAAGMKSLARTLEDELNDRELGRTGQPFTPHLTIGRLRRGAADWRAALAAAPAVDATFRVEVLVLVDSTLAPGGSIYRVRATLPLGAAS